MSHSILYPSRKPTAPVQISAGPGLDQFLHMIIHVQWSPQVGATNVKTIDPYVSSQIIVLLSWLYSYSNGVEKVKKILSI